MHDNSTLGPRSRKAKAKSLTHRLRPYKGFPLSAHASGAWQKKIRGKIHYFGKWGRVVDGKLQRLPDDGWREALAMYEAQRDALHSGRTPRLASDELTLGDLCNRFLTSRHRKVTANEMTVRSFGEYREVTDRLIHRFGKERIVDDLSAEDFESLRAEFAKTCGPISLGNLISRTRTLFKYGFSISPAS